MSKPTTSNSKLPTEIVDCHHHFMDTTKTGISKDFLGPLLGGDFAYLPEDYRRDVVEKLEANGIKLLGSVHVEGIPDDGLAEAKWLTSSLKDTTVSAIVASCDLDSPDAPQILENLKACSPKVKGIRWILDSVGPFEPNTASHIATSRHAEGKHDYLRGNNGEPLPAFEKGFALLGTKDLNFSFDLQCAPAQLPQAVALCKRHPEIPVCINHLGKPRPDITETVPAEEAVPSKEALEEWRAGMKAMADLPNVYVKISMLGYIVPGWTRTPERTQLVKDLVRETVQLFGAKRCMVGLNWWKDAAMSDSDGMSDVGPDPVEFVRYMSEFFEDFSDEDRQRLFAGTAREFYRF